MRLTEGVIASLIFTSVDDAHGAQGINPRPGAAYGELEIKYGDQLFKVKVEEIA